ncbi:MAG: SDR family oxidoreductase [Planctomycetota bacterium]|jgi:NAD(P)-dependent dehydrogenase (short-subunit alcohol dehydrogenase family)
MNYLPDKAFEGQTAIVTGGGTGLGLATSTRLGRLGANVVCMSRDTGHHTEILRRGKEEEFQVMSAALDVREPEEVKRVVREAAARFGAIDVLVNNAAGNFLRPALLLAPKGFKAVVDIALNGVFYMSREVGRIMRDKGGSIVNISAPYASTGKPGVVHSACAKAGVDAMTRSLAAEWAQYRIRVNAVSPGPFVSKGAAERLWPSEEIEKAVLDQIPLGRFGTAEEIAELVCLLASPAASWITGSVLLADGGWSLPEAMVNAEDPKILRRRKKED